MTVASAILLVVFLVAATNCTKEEWKKLFLAFAAVPAIFLCIAGVVWLFLHPAVLHSWLR